MEFQNRYIHVNLMHASLNVAHFAPTMRSSKAAASATAGGSWHEMKNKQA